MQDVVGLLQQWLSRWVKLDLSFMVPNSGSPISILSWDQYEQKQIRHSKSFINMEYAVSEEKLEEALKFVLQFRAKYMPWYSIVVRPVGSDTRGFLSATRNDEGKPYYFLDITYSRKEADRPIYEEIEDGLINMGGRVSFSRLIFKMSSKLLKNFWDKDGLQWKKVKEELDPEHVFTNPLVNTIFYDNKIAL